ncbi:MAG TPA: M20/M25/M40 family metallo-hydrolase [Candidatus Dormibacteraeota bacterium]|nr:M20/M25/M40 family metallo-hydrolase [Candidatus Dormibacteraeota bacterium]
MPPAQLLQELIRFRTINPPGNEEPCQRHLRTLFEARGVPTWLLCSLPDRPNLVVRVPGRGEAPPLLLQGHVDVVTVAGQRWTRDPFGGELVDGWVWGRGALDMKGGVAMMVSALLRCLDQGRPPAGDVVLCCLADEEAGGVHGAQFLVEHHADLFRGIRHGLGEGGGATLTLEGRRFYPIMVAEKRICRLRMVVRGPGGHASQTHRGGVMAGLGRLLLALDRGRLPVRITPPAADYVRGIALAMAEPTRSRLLALLDPARSDAVMDEMGTEALRFDPILRNTVNATVVRAGEKVNVIPSEAVVEVDGRMVPGCECEWFLEELRELVGPEPEIEVVSLGPPLQASERGPFYELLGAVLRELEPGAIPVPLLMTGATDQRHFGRLGIQGYGYLPLRLPAGFGQETVHAADERVPVAALDFGTEALFRVLQRYRG